MRGANMSAPSSSESSTASTASASGADTSLTNPAVSEKVRRRMQRSSEPVHKRECCPCCGRNFRAASNNLAKFRDYLRQQQQPPQPPPQQQPKQQAAATAAKNPSILLEDFSEAERRILLSDDFLVRLLARCGCEFPRCLERLVGARTVHRKYGLDSATSCRPCTDRLGFHSFRQVGFDKAGRPVLYTCLNQDLETGTQPEQIRAYFVHMILAVCEAEKTIPPGQHSLVLVFDTTGLGMNHVRTDNVAQFGEMLRYFPSRMSYALMLSLSGVTRFLLKPVIHLTGHKEDVMLLANAGLDSQLSECFDPPLVQWMLQETERNQSPKMPFWLPPTATSATKTSAAQQGPPSSTAAASASPGVAQPVSTCSSLSSSTAAAPVSPSSSPSPSQPPHDPRGEQSYVDNYVARSHPSGHQPHPSIVASDAASKAKS